MCPRNKHLSRFCSISYVTSFSPLAKPSSDPYKLTSLEKDRSLLRYLRTYCTQQSLLENNQLSGSQKLAAFYGTQRFINAFACARVQFRGFVTRYVLRWGVVSISRNHQFGGPQLVGCPRLLIRTIRSYLPYWRPFLHPQPEDAPCLGDRETFITVKDHKPHNIYYVY